MSRTVKGDSQSEGNTIRVVSARTGLGMETLRAWERRYGFPKPERRAGSNRRLYSASDLQRLMAIQRLRDRGFRVGDVIGKTVGQLEELAEIPKERRPDEGPLAMAPITELVDLLARDRVLELEAQLRRSAVALGPRRFVTELAHPFAVAVGQGWAEGELSIRHEHLATESLVTQLRLMLAGYQDIEGYPLVLLSTLPGEPHTLPLEMVAVYLVAIGARPRLLGGSTPPGEILESAKTLRAGVVGVTVTRTSDRRSTRRDLKTLRRALSPHVPLWIGGEGAPALELEGEGVHVITSWTGIEHAVASCRTAAQRTRVAR